MNRNYDKKYFTLQKSIVIGYHSFNCATWWALPKLT